MLDGSENGSVTLGGRRVEVTRPRARTLDGHEVPLQADSQFAAEDLLSQIVLERMLAGVATRRHARIAEPIGKAVLDSASCTGRSVVSRRFMKETETALAELHARDLTEDKIKVLMLDGEHMTSRCVIVDFAITADGRRLPVGLWDGATRQGEGPGRREARQALQPPRPGARTQEHQAPRRTARQGPPGRREQPPRGPRGGVHRQSPGSRSMPGQDARHFEPESMMSIARTANRNVTRWRDGHMVQRWTAARMLNAEQIPPLSEALHRHAHPPTASQTETVGAAALS